MTLDANNPEFPINGEVSSLNSTVFGIFDGMGGEECGEVASLIAAETAGKIQITDKPVAQMKEFCKVANQNICDYAHNNSVSSMGTTAAVLCFCKKKIALCNIGDSKIFLLSADDFQQISKDHITPMPYGRKPALLQNLGIPTTEMIIEPYISIGEYHDGDKYLICSDGLTDMVSNDQIKDIVEQGSPGTVIQTLLDVALKNGGRDNITIMLFEIKKNKKKIFDFLYKK